MILVFSIYLLCSLNDNKNEQNSIELSDLREKNVIIEVTTTTTVITTQIEEIPENSLQTQISDKLIENTVPIIINQVEKKIKCYVVSKDSNKSSLLEILNQNGVSPLHVYKGNVNGVSFCTENMEIISNLQSQGFQIEEDTIYKISSVQSPISRHLFLLSNYTNSFFNSYFYDNIIFRLLQLERLFRYYQGSYKYYYTGKNTKIYMLDTTVNVSAPNINNFSGRKRSCNSHGDVNVNLLIDPRKGFARDTEITVLDGVDCEGNIKLSDILFYLDLIKRDNKGTVLLFGVSGPYSEILNNIINNIGNTGVIIIAPAGNDHDNACYHSPSSAKKVLSVGSVNKFANISSFSNYGSCVRLYSLGENIYENSRTKGTSHSATTVAGAVLMYLEKYSNASFSNIWTFLNNNSYWNDNYLVFKLPYLSQEYKATTVDYKESGSNSESIISFIFLFFLIFLISFIVYFCVCKILERKHQNDYVIDPNLRHQHL